MANGVLLILRHSTSDKVLDFVATEDSKLDLGTIASSFGLNPLSLRLNGLYVSRGPDFISSVTWRNLLEHFAKNNYSLGKTDQDSILVEGKPYSPHSNGSWLNGNRSENLNSSNSEEMGPGSKRKVWFENSIIGNGLKRSKNVEENLVLSTGQIGSNPFANTRISLDCGADHGNCYSKRGREEDFEGMLPEKKHARFQYDSDVHSKGCVEHQKQQITWNGGNLQSVTVIMK